MREYVLYCDESKSTGKYFGNFYGGVLIDSANLDHCVQQLLQRKEDLNLHSEVKYQRITEQYLEKYLSLMELFFDLIEQRKLRVRVMFTQNMNIAVGLTPQQREDSYFLLYYQFIKHAFGFIKRPPDEGPARIRIYFDQFPDTKEKARRFIDFVLKLQEQQEFAQAGLTMRREDITEIDSKKHVLLQCLDVVLGSMYFRLNDLHKEKPLGSRTRGKRTIAKEKLYKYISGRIRKMLPGFNIGISTGLKGNELNAWLHPYGHWLFVPAQSRVDPTLCKPKRKGPISPTSIPCV